MRRLVPIAVLLLCLAPACGGQGGAVKNGAIAPGRVLKQAGKLKTATVRGKGFPVGRSQLVVAGQKEGIFALGDPGAIRSVKTPGERVRVTGAVRRLDKKQATELADAVAKAGSARSPEVARAHRKPGDPYLAIQRVVPAKQGRSGGKKR